MEGLSLHVDYPLRSDDFYLFIIVQLDRANL